MADLPTGSTISLAAAVTFAPIGGPYEPSISGSTNGCFLGRSDFEISDTLSKARQQLLENFDDEVREKLRVSQASS